MNMKEAVVSGYRKSFQKRGRASRSEFWYFFLWYAILEVMDPLLKRGLMASDRSGQPSLVLLLGAMVFSVFVILSAYPLVAVQIRRLHDVGKSGWWIVASIMVSAATEGVIVWKTFAALKTHTLAPFVRSLVSGDHRGFVIGVLVGLIATMALGITVFIFTVLPSQPEENVYGPNPLGSQR